MTTTWPEINEMSLNSLEKLLFAHQLSHKKKYVIIQLLKKADNVITSGFDVLLLHSENVFFFVVVVCVYVCVCVSFLLKQLWLWEYFFPHSFFPVGIQNCFQQSQTNHESYHYI